MAKGKSVADSERLQARLIKLVGKKDWSGILELATPLADSDFTPAAGCALALAHLMTGSADLAHQMALRAHQAVPEAREPVALLALTYALVGMLNESIYYRKLETVGTVSDPQLAPFVTEDLPPFHLAFLEMRERGLFERGNACLTSGLWAAAETYYRQQLYFTPEDLETNFGLVMAWQQQQAWSSVISLLTSLRHIQPDNPVIAAELGVSLFHYGRHADAAVLLEEARRLDPDSVLIAGRRLMALSRSPVAPSVVRDEHRRWIGTRPAAAAVPLAMRDPAEGGLLVGCLIGSAVSTARARAFARILGWVNNSQVKFIGFGHGGLSLASNAPFQAVMKDWIDVQDSDPLTIGRVVSAQGCHIVIDLAGLETPGLMQVLDQRCAPVQLSWSGVAYPVGLRALDAVISDPLAEDGAAEDGLARLLLDHGSLLTSLPHDAREWPEAPQRAPDTPVVLGLDAPFCEMSAETVALWARVVKALPEATLLLRDRDYAQPGNSDRLRDIFSLHGITHRIEVVTESDVISFYAQTDLLLTAPHSVMQMAEPMWMGCVPVVLAGPSHSERTQRTLLVQAGLTEALAASADEYVEKAVRLARDPARLQELRAGLRGQMSGMALLDPACRAADLTRLLQDAWNNRAQG